MTTLNEARELIYTRFVNEWLSTQYVFDNETFEPPAEGWVRLTVRNTVGNQETLGQSGNRKFERKGLVFVQIFVPLNEGLKSADLLAQAARSIFEAKRFGDLCFWSANVQERQPEDQWFQVAVEIPFTYNEVK